MKKFIKCIESIIEYPYLVPVLLGFHFVLHALFYLNTNMFEGISEAGSLLQRLDGILEGERPLPLLGFYWYITPSYIAYFFISIFGTIHAYYLFQCLLGTLTTYFVYRIVLLLLNAPRGILRSDL